MNSSTIYLGVMSGTSLDGVDVVAFDTQSHHLLAAHSIDFSAELRASALHLQSQQFDDLHLSQLLANILADLYARAINELMTQSGLHAVDIAAVGVHGQTIRHRPDLGYSVQLNQAARIAEQTNLTVVSDFRARDIAAGGQGAPLVPAFHDALWRDDQFNRVILNIGGFANISLLNVDTPTFGYDTGPGNVLMDTWIQQQQGLNYDKNGEWAASGTINHPLLNAFLTDTYFSQTHPKSTGRDSFHLDWLLAHLVAFPEVSSADVQATLLALTARSVTLEILRSSPNIDELIVCGGGAYNDALLNALRNNLPNVCIRTSDNHGIGAQYVEAAAFAWLASRTMQRLSSNLPSVTGASGARILGQITFAA